MMEFSGLADFVTFFASPCIKVKSCVVKMCGCSWKPRGEKGKNPYFSEHLGWL
jgi:hypothetical protein